MKTKFYPWNIKGGRAWWHLPVIPMLDRWRQEDSWGLDDHQATVLGEFQGSSVRIPVSKKTKWPGGGGAHFQALHSGARGRWISEFMGSLVYIVTRLQIYKEKQKRQGGQLWRVALKNWPHNCIHIRTYRKKMHFLLCFDQLTKRDITTRLQFTFLLSSPYWVNREYYLISPDDKEMKM